MPVERRRERDRQLVGMARIPASVGTDIGPFLGTNVYNWRRLTDQLRYAHHLIFSPLYNRHAPNMDSNPSRQLIGGLINLPVGKPSKTRYLAAVEVARPVLRQLKRVYDDVATEAWLNHAAQYFYKRFSGQSAVREAVRNQWLTRDLIKQTARDILKYLEKYEREALFSKYFAAPHATDGIADSDTDDEGAEEE